MLHVNNNNKIPCLQEFCKTFARNSLLAKILQGMHFTQGFCKIFSTNPRKMHYLARSWRILVRSLQGYLFFQSQFELLCLQKQLHADHRIRDPHLPHASHILQSVRAERRQKGSRHEWRHWHLVSGQRKTKKWNTFQMFSFHAFNGVLWTCI